MHSAQVWFGYGELNVTRPSNDPAQARIGLVRFVVGLGYRLDERTRPQSELAPGVIGGSGQARRRRSS